MRWMPRLQTLAASLGQACEPPSPCGWAIHASRARSFFLIDRPTQGKWELGIGESREAFQCRRTLSIHRPPIHHAIDVWQSSASKQAWTGPGLDHGNPAPRRHSWFGQPVPSSFRGAHGRLLGGKGSRLAGPNLRYYLTKLAQRVCQPDLQALDRHWTGQTFAACRLLSSLPRASERESGRVGGREEQQQEGPGRAAGFEFRRNKNVKKDSSDRLPIHPSIKSLRKGGCRAQMRITSQLSRVCVVGSKQHVLQRTGNSGAFPGGRPWSAGALGRPGRGAGVLESQPGYSAETEPRWLSLVGFQCAQPSHNRGHLHSPPPMCTCAG